MIINFFNRLPQLFFYSLPQLTVNFVCYNLYITSKKSEERRRQIFYTTPEWNDPWTLQFPLKNDPYELNRHIVWQNNAHIVS